MPIKVPILWRLVTTQDVAAILKNYRAEFDAAVLDMGIPHSELKSTFNDGMKV